MDNSKLYRPRIYAGSERCEALLKLCEFARLHDGFTERELEIIMEFEIEIGGRHLIKRALDQLRAQTPPEVIGDVDLPRGVRDNDFENWTIKELEERKLDHIANIGLGKLPYDLLAQLDEQLEIKRVRETEQTPIKIRPPQDD